METGSLSALDALLVINQMNRPTSDLVLASGEDMSDIFDVNKDGLISALDALVIINRLKRGDPFAIPGQNQHDEEAEDETVLDSAPTLLF